MASHKNHKIKQNSLPFSARFILRSQGSAKNPTGHKITENELLMFPPYIYMYIVVNLNHERHSRPNSLSFNSCVAIDLNFFRVKKQERSDVAMRESFSMYRVHEIRHRPRCTHQCTRVADIPWAISIWSGDFHNDRVPLIRDRSLYGNLLNYSRLYKSG